MGIFCAALATGLAPIVGIIYRLSIAGLNIVMAAYLAATERIRASAWISVARGIIIIIPILLILAYFYHMDGVWLFF
ncbi:hypothetical protein ACPWSR_00190 [Alloiococcus sp. CFN-8]|uniref:hypothetical protein n=1 Tax=Alloiococcus sp. CFN-8 TaxID=3416081 RepID=UPI003CEC99AC